jgi:tRNA (guanine37-N1)-methyltransferase
MKETGLQIEKSQAEKIRKYLIEHDLLIKNLKINRDEKFIYFPIRDLPKSNIKYKLLKMKFKKIKEIPKSYKEIALIPKELKDKLPTSYDIIGNIIIIKLPNELIKYKNEIGNALLKLNKNIRTICLTSSISGELRTRNLEVISGEKITTTMHKEYGLKYFLDVSKTYFSPRLAEERKKVSGLVKPGEIIVDMFAGIAPFSIMIAKYAEPKIIYAFDKNKYAIEFAKKNVKLNNVIDKIDVILADSKNVKKILDEKELKINRIIMNLPFLAHKYLPYALQLISDKCLIHYYDIIEEKQLKERLKELGKIGNKHRISFIKHNIRKIKTYSPREFYIGIDITAKKI